MSNTRVLRFSQQVVTVITVLSVALPLHLFILVPNALAATLYSEDFDSPDTSSLSGIGWDSYGDAASREGGSYAEGGSGRGLRIDGDSGGGVDEGAQVEHIVTDGYSSLSVSYDRHSWNNSDAETGDTFEAEYSLDGGDTWTTFDSLGDINNVAYASVGPFAISNPDRRGGFSLRFSVRGSADDEGVAIDNLVVAGTNTPIFFDEFPTANSDVPGWDEQSHAVTVSGSDGDASPGSGYPHARIGEDSDGWIRTTIDTTGFENIMLAYTWRGDSDAESNDDLYVEWREGTSGDWTELADHNPSLTDWYFEKHSLVPEDGNDADNTTIQIRFRSDFSTDSEHARIDDVVVWGDVYIPPTGSITVCKVILDPDDNIVDGSGLGGPEFSIGHGEIETAFFAPMTLNVNLFGGEGNDAHCETWGGLELGTYTYDNENTDVTHAGNVVWNDPLFSDFYDLFQDEGGVDDVGDILPISLDDFDEPASEDTDGSIDLGNDAGDHRVLVFVNQYEEPICGDDIVNQESEQCDGDEGCIMEGEEDVVCTYPAGVTLTKFDDENGNGEWDEDESPIEGWLMCLTPQGEEEEEENFFAAVFASIFGVTQIEPPSLEQEGDTCRETNSNGNAFWEDVTQGEYFASEENQSNWTNTTIEVDGAETDPVDIEIVQLSLSSTAPITVVGGESHQVVFGNNYQTPTVTGGGGGNSSAPNISVTKTADPASVNPGGTVTYTIVVTNNGTATAANVMLNDVMDAQLDGTTGSTRTWSLGYLDPGESTTIEYVIDVPAGLEPGSYNNVATVTGSNTVSASSNAVVSVVTGQVLGEETTPELDVTVQVDPPFGGPGSDFNVTISVQNTGNAAAENVTVDLSLPEGMTQNDEGTASAVRAILAALIADVHAAELLAFDAGDLLAGESWSTTLSVNTGTLPAGIYTLHAGAYANNHGLVSGSGDIDIRAGEVLGFTTLPETGGVANVIATFGAIVLLLLTLYGAGVTAVLRRKGSK